ncbi:L-idonate 5-dehydrogenase [Acuticoccus sp. MNP-M23]|uniref:L-idonate 5-dehydrogenase n=1 Tax=Acuticoccus sp. MNP-M23 TaxID=3072793 RepID=UPI002814BBD4|nr:L-idonate 5-dehydrogenase [Acuticoccus sp. MNP-M23]WMS44890.1 L-idonate 5-dehydrogenase [Acuticoccus sp. MNP-M23]
MTTRVLKLHAKGDIRVEDEAIAAPGKGEVVVAMERGGICGSDLHYFHSGRAGASIVREPIILGHEVAGRIVEAGPGTDAPIGALVAVNPSRPCGECRFCREGVRHQCLNMRFLGSAMFLPHEHGGFRDKMVVDAAQCVVMENASAGAAACAEPLAVCLHAAHVGPSLMGRRVLITGAGPIGALMTGVAKAAGAAEIVVTDLAEAPLDVARKMGATEAVVAAKGALDRWAPEKGQFDVAFECSGAGPAIASALTVLRPGGTLVQVGIAAEATLPLGMLVAKEIQYCGSFRFDAEFGESARMIDTGRIDVTPILTATMPLEGALEAFGLAADRQRAVKVQLAFAG